jgi:hypothetical protein
MRGEVGLLQPPFRLLDDFVPWKGRMMKEEGKRLRPGAQIRITDFGMRNDLRLLLVARSFFAPSPS